MGQSSLQVQQLRMNNVRLNPRGFSILELMLALMILTATVSAVVLITIGLPITLADGNLRAQAIQIANTQLQKEYILGLTSFSSVSSIGSSSENSYTRSLTVTTKDGGMSKLLSSMVSWIDPKGKNQYVALTGRITDFNATNFCNPVLLGDWMHPHSFIQPFASHPFQTLVANSSLLVAAAINTPQKTDATISLFSLASSTNPVLVGEIDTATSTRAGFAALAIHNSLVFGASANAANFATCVSGPACSQLQIIDISSTTHPSVIQNLQLAASSGPYATGSGGQSAGKSIFYANGIIYLGLQKTGVPNGHEFNIINVENPYTPIWLGGYSVGRTINQIRIVNGFAYLATDNPAKELLVLDVHDPAHITLVTSYDAPGNSAFGFGEALDTASTTLIFGRSYILNEPEFTLFDISSATSPHLLGTEPIASSTDSILSLTLRSFLAFVLTSSAVEFWNIANTSIPSPYAIPYMLPGTSPVVGTNGLACSGNALFVASSDSNNTGYITTITSS